MGDGGYIDRTSVQFQVGLMFVPTGFKSFQSGIVFVLFAARSGLSLSSEESTMPFFAVKTTTAPNDTEV